MRKALVVGINEYLNSPLTGCVNDADAMQSILEHNGDGSVNFSVKKLTDSEVGTKGILKGHIQECFSGDAGVALFYFSGHGYIDSIGGYIVTPDYTPNDWGVSMQELLTIVNQSKCKNKVVVLDCCHAGFMGNISTSGQETTVICEGVTILTAGKQDESAIEISGHGVFTTLLIDALSGGAADVTGHITPGGTYAYIDKSLGPWQQRPIFKTNVTAFSPLRTVKPQVDISVLKRITEYFPTPNGEHRLDPSYEPTNTTNVTHEVIEPYANDKHVAIFNDLQKLEGVGLVAPCGAEHMYYAAMNSKSCCLTSAGQHYWRLADTKRI
jgi:hypothetical protein